MTPCDFCGTVAASWLYEVPEENIPLLVAAGDGIAAPLPVDDGLWNACFICAPFVDGRDVGALLNHIITGARRAGVSFADEPLWHALLIGKYTPLMLDGTRKKPL
ncbi:hypothetical protein OG432_10905 [Streptomyces sp. NBC_00442]|uniref:hypothetical protein n=1 Tax=Streptomyces sp. NBC_00442 TaxID=2903651 RepID=UPI002E22C44E